MSCDPRRWTRVDGVDKGRVVIALVVLDSVLGDQVWALAGLATIDVTRTSEAEKALMEFVGQLNEKLLDWKSSFGRSGVDRGAEVIHRFRKRLLGIASCSKWGKDQLDKMRPQTGANPSWPPSLHPVLNRPLDATPIIQQAASQAGEILDSVIKEDAFAQAFAQHCLEVASAFNTRARINRWPHEMLDSIYSMSVQESTLPQSRMLGTHYPEKFLRADWPSDASWHYEMLDSTYSLTVQVSTLSHSQKLGAHYPEKFLRADCKSDTSWHYEMLDSIYSLSVRESTLPQSRMLGTHYPEKFLRADWPSHASWHEMLDSTYSLTVQVSTFTHSQKLRPHYPEKLLRADCKSDTSWHYEMLDSIHSLSVQESCLPQSRILVTHYPEKFLRADWPSDASWHCEMLDSTCSLTVQVSTLSHSQKLGAHYPEKFLRADCKSDASWHYEMLDSIYSLTVQVTTLPQQMLGAHYPKKFVIADWPSDASWLHDAFAEAILKKQQQAVLLGEQHLQVLGPGSSLDDADEAIAAATEILFWSSSSDDAPAASDSLASATATGQTDSMWARRMLAPDTLELVRQLVNVWRLAAHRELHRHLNTADTAALQDAANVVNKFVKNDQELNNAVKARVLLVNERLAKESQDAGDLDGHSLACAVVQALEPKVSLIFLLDQSGSITQPVFDGILKNCAEQLVQFLVQRRREVGGLEFAAVAFGPVETISGFTTEGQVFADRIRKHVYGEERTPTDKAFRRALDLFDEQSSSAASAVRLVFHFTDGVPDELQSAKDELAALQTQSGAVVVGIGIGTGIEFGRLRAISSKGLAIHMADFDHLRTSLHRAFELIDEAQAQCKSVSSEDVLNEMQRSIQRAVA
ncbi:unnamed protein product [Symbiodinium sp. CCMP2592]|nr:unnamed protein product [Symbiodinium sp. CCMP2592]